MTKLLASRNLMPIVSLGTVIWCKNWTSTLRQETGGGEGVEVVKNEPFEGLDFLGGKYTKGQYTYKIYHVDTKVPPLLRSVRIRARKCFPSKSTEIWFTG